VHDANMHLTAYAGWLTDLRERRRTFDILFDERAPGLDDVRARSCARCATRSCRTGQQSTDGARRMRSFEPRSLRTRAHGWEWA
jgi:hypothetical protein